MISYKNRKIHRRRVSKKYRPPQYSRRIGSLKRNFDIALIIANGPSVDETDMHLWCDEDKEFDTFMINRPDSRYWPTDYWIYADEITRKQHVNFWRRYKGTPITTYPAIQTNTKTVVIKTLSGLGFSTNFMRGSPESSMDFCRRPLEVG